ncbi:hypothetical protein CDD81_5792 [Ophiocordyceps australis]|uniref:Cyclochlorotine biosynthesis protein O n=1 Tax=Ophiocordyceps australis TaxID=1399860 RepID=A0A2C5Y9F0_9HYPO|nr:hypothetical protein CDD81_5792 [Ophiocordyceps australis]
MPQSLELASDSDTLLSQERGSSESNEKPRLASFPLNKRRSWTSILTPLIIHLGLAAVYSTLFFAYWDFRSAAPVNRNKPGLKAYSPAWEAIEWEPRLFHNQIERSNPFKGPPRPELDEAWNKLLGPTAVKVSKETLDKINRTSVPLLDGSGYMAALDVYHQLHCLRYVRRYLHKDYYNMTEEKNLGQHIGKSTLSA